MSRPAGRAAGAGQGAGTVSPARGVGLWLDRRGATIAVVRPGPPRVTAIAGVAWPAGSWADGTPAAGPLVRRLLARARRRLGLPRWEPVAVVLAAGLAVPGDGAGAAPRSAQLLAQARLVQGWVVPPGRAAELRHAAAVAVDPRLTAAVAEPDAALAVGAALAALAPPDVAGYGIDEQEWPVRDEPFTGWAVEPVGAVGKPQAPGAANAW